MHQVRQIAHCSEEELLRQKICLLVIYVSTPIFFSFSLLCHLEKLDFSYVSTEAGHEPVFEAVVPNLDGIGMRRRSAAEAAGHEPREQPEPLWSHFPCLGWGVREGEGKGPCFTLLE